jgi:hypothetical protein
MSDELKVGDEVLVRARVHEVHKVFIKVVPFGDNKICYTHPGQFYTAAEIDALRAALAKHKGMLESSENQLHETLAALEKATLEKNMLKHSYKAFINGNCNSTTARNLIKEIESGGGE